MTLPEKTVNLSATQMCLQKIQQGIELTSEEKQTANRERFLAYSKLKISLPEIVKSKGFSSLKTWIRIWGEENIEDFLYLAIDDICSYLNVGKNMSLVQIRQTAKLIMQRFPELSMEDIKAWSD